MRELRPSAGWALAAAAALVAAVVGSALLHRVISSVEEANFTVISDALERDIEEQLEDLRFQMAGFGAVLVSLEPSGDPAVLEGFLTSAGSVAGPSGLGVLGTGALQAAVFYRDLSDIGRSDADFVMPLLPGAMTELETRLRDLAPRSEGTTVNGPLGPNDPRYVFVHPVATADGSTAAMATLVRPSALIQAALAEAGEDYLVASVTDVSGDSPVLLLPGEPERTELTETRRIDVAGRTWELMVWPGPTYPISGAGIARITGFGFGFVVALLLLLLGVVDRWRLEHQQERVRLAEELVRSKDQFVASVSHELRTPLTVVHGFAEELADSLVERNDEIREIARLIADQSDEMGHLIEDLLVAARAEVGTIMVLREPVDAETEVRAVVDRLGRSRELVITIEGSTGPVLGDPLRIRQIVRNLVGNAVRHGGSNVRIELDATDLPTVRVMDDGPGVPEADRDRIFLPYHHLTSSPTNPASVGLGLTVARELARRMGGDIVYRRVDGWSVFEVTLQPVGAEHLQPT